MKIDPLIVFVHFFFDAVQRHFLYLGNGMRNQMYRMRITEKFFHKIFESVSEVNCEKSTSKIQVEIDLPKNVERCCCWASWNGFWFWFPTHDLFDEYLWWKRYQAIRMVWHGMVCLAFDIFIVGICAKWILRALRSDAIWEIELLARIQPKMMIQYESESEKRDKIYYGKFGSNRFDRLDAPIDIYLLRTICYLDSVNSVRGPM